MNNILNVGPNYLKNMVEDRENVMLKLEVRRNKLVFREKNMMKRHREDNIERNKLDLEEDFF